MLNKLSIRWRLTLLVSITLTISCVLLSGLLNFSSKRQLRFMASTPSQIIATEIAETVPSEMLTPSIPMVPVQPYYDKINSETILFSLLIIFIGSIATYFLSTKILKPIIDLSSDVSSLTENNLNTKMSLPLANDEVYTLISSFNVMTENLSKAFETQKSFSANVSHELRTPLTVMQTKLDVFKKNTLPNNQDYAELIIDIEKQTKKLSSLVVDILDFSNLQNTVLDENVELNSLIYEVICDLQPIADQKNISVTINSTNLSVLGSDALLYRVFYNIIENAMKYNYTDGNVFIEILGNKVFIKDTGFGIPNHMKKEVLNAFTRVDKSRSREYGGVGLGLAIVNEIIALHGATVEVRDNSPKGSVFVVEFL